MTLNEFFKENRKVAIAFSGGVDSAYLLYAAVKSGADVKAYYMSTCFQPEFELEDAKRLVAGLGAQMQILTFDILSDSSVKSNPANRCYFCKNRIFSGIIEAAKADGFTVICDGTNASDDEGDRPGMKALKELKVCSPLRDAGLTKVEIRRLSKEAGLFTWDKPAYACLATRIPAGTEITEDMLERTEKAEGYLFSKGFKDFRVRMSGKAGKLQLKKEEFEKYFREKEEIDVELLKYYDEILFDEEGR